jgi:hypothetical protein
MRDLMVWRLSIVALAAAVLGTSVTSAAQQIGASRTALATVVDSRGRAIVDIEPDDFVVRETGRAREVLSVRVADYPIALVLDNGPGAASDFTAIRQAAARFVGRVGHRPVAVALADPPHLIATFDDDRSVVVQSLERAMPGESGEGLFDALVIAARQVQENGSAFSVIVVVSANPLATPPSELLTPILATSAAVHVIVNGATAAAGRPLETLREVADQTHGQFTTIYATASYQAALDRLANRLAPELMLEYVVPVGSTSGNDVQLGVRIPGARVLGLGVR